MRNLLSRFFNFLLLAQVLKINITLYPLQQKFWILGAKIMAQQVIPSCYKYFRHRSFYLFSANFAGHCVSRLAETLLVFYRHENCTAAQSQTPISKDLSFPSFHLTIQKRKVTLLCTRLYIPLQFFLPSFLFSCES